MTVSDRVSKYIDSHPEVISNIKRFRALVLDLSENDIQFTNLIVAANEDGLHLKIAKRKKADRNGISNLVHSFAVRHCIDKKFEDSLYEFYANVFAEREITEEAGRSDDNFDPIINLKLKSTPSKRPQKPCEWYCPCGGNKKDFGFYIRRVKEDGICTNQYAAIYAVVLGMLQRSINPDKSVFLKEFEKEIRQEIQLSDVLRYEILILELVKNNYDKDNILTFSDKSDRTSIKAALYEINGLSQIISDLALINYSPLTAEFSDNGIEISEDGIHAESAVSRDTFTRIQWNENQLIYTISKENESGLYKLLDILFGYESFLPGQKECLINILNSRMKSSVTILPVGGGKSLIYYFVSYLKSSPVFVVSPTVLLISDQIRNLKLFHDIDDVSHISYEMDYSDYYPSNKLIFLTPKTFLNRDLLCRLIKLNFKHLVGGVVLDEVHCISNWGHDFRPEYLMLSYNLNEFLSDQGNICFTGTANYKIINDIRQQLNIDTESVYCPVALKNSLFSFKFESKDSKEEICTAISKEIEIVSKDSADKRTIVFTKTPEEGRILYNLLSEGSKSDVDLSGNRFTSYHDFINGDTNAIICGEKFGVGINLPRINNIIHVGAPLSKGQYIQEIGRAARNIGKSNSYVCYLGRNAFNRKDLPILDRSVPAEKLTELYNDAELSDEGKLIVSKLFGNIEKREILENNVLKVMETIDSLNKDGRISYRIDENKDFKTEISRITRYFYILFRTGYIYGWYFDHIDETNRLVTFYIDPGSEKPDLDKASEFTIEYISKMGNHRKTITEIKHSRTFKELVKSYTKWYYSQLLYYHREQYLDMLEFLDNSNSDNTIISNEINRYFSLSILNIQKNSLAAKELSVNEIFNAASQITNTDIKDNIISALETEYSSKLDLFIFIYNSVINSTTDTKRLKRVLDNSTEEERKQILDNISPLVHEKDKESALNIISVLTEYFSLKEILDIIYRTHEKDVVYYFIVSMIGNNIFRG